MKPNFRKKSHDIADFVVDDAASIASSATYRPDLSSPGSPQVRRSVPRTYGKPNSTRLRQQVIPSTSSDIGEDLESDPEKPDEPPIDVGAQTSGRPLRGAAADAASPIRKHARIDLGYISDLAETYDSDDEDELEADGMEYAPFETQVQQEHGDQIDTDIPDCEDIGALNGPPFVRSDQFAEIASSIPETGLFPLIEEARVAEHASGSKFGQYFYNEARVYWTEMSLLTLCSTAERAIIELVCGNLKLAYDMDVDLRNTLDSLEQRAKKHPCIYARTLTTADGQPMTIAQARRLAKWLQRYVSDDPRVQAHPTCQEAFRRIDAEFGGQWRRANQQAQRAYLATASSTRLDSRVENVRVFCQQLLAECDRCEAKKVPLRPLLYIGYAARADRRKRQHEACGKSANWLATLVQAICNVLWGRGHLKMHFMVICVLAEKRQGIVAEMLFTRITGAYYTAGTGFCIDVAGKSMESLHFKELTTVQNVDVWNEYHQWVEQNTALVANSQLQLQRHTQFTERQATKKREQAQSDTDRVSNVLTDIRDSQMLCETYEKDDCWQDEDAQNMVGKMKELWDEARKVFPQYR